MAALKRLVPPAAFALLAIAAVFVFAHDRTQRKAPRAFAERHGFPVRRPAWLETLELAPSADIGSDVLATAALSDALDTRRWNELTPEEQQAWLVALSHLDEELDGARELLLDALRARPGWAYHRMLLGQVVYAAGRRTLDPRLATRADEWIRPLRLAEAAAPGEEAIAPFLAGAYLESWQKLPESVRSDLNRVLSRAFADDQFVARALPAARGALGDERALRLVPARPASLLSARDGLLKAKAPEGAAGLDARWEAAERRARRDDLENVRTAARRGDVAGLKERCRAFVNAHPPAALDGPVERRALAEVLALWPTEESGSFRSDPRGELLRFFADGRLADVRSDAFSASVEALSEAPDTYRALGRLLSGDLPAFQTLVLSSDAKGSLGFTPVFLEWARRELRLGHAENASDALSHLSTFARGECDALIVARDIARGGGDAAARQKANDALAERLRAPLVPSDRSVAVCVDPLAGADATLSVSVRVSAPALVVWGFRGARRGARLLPAGESTLEFSLEGERGMTALTLQPLGDARLELLGASRSARPAAMPAPTTAESVAAVAGIDRLKSAAP